MADKTEFGILVDSTDEEFIKHCEGKDLGYVSSLRNHIAGAYQTFVAMKDELVKKIKNEGLSEDSEEVNTVKGIYAEMMKLEHKATLCVSIIKERSLKD